LLHDLYDRQSSNGIQLDKLIDEDDVGSTCGQ
jgi:hypothetical protein